MRQDRFDKYKWLWGTIFVSFGALLAYSVRKTKALWIGMGLSLILVVSAAEATCYYWSIWVLAAVLSRVKRQMEWPLLAVMLGSFAFAVCKILIGNKAALTVGNVAMNDTTALTIAIAVVGLLYYYFHDVLLKFTRTPGTMEISILALAAVSQLYSNQFYYIDDKFTAISVVYVAWTAAFVAAFVPIPQVVLRLVSRWTDASTPALPAAPPNTSK